MEDEAYGSSVMGEESNGAERRAPRETESGGGNVDRIRDIIFGQQMRDYDRRFSGLEERLLNESAVLRDDVGKRLAATEQFLRGELDALAARLSAEQRDRTQGMREGADATATLHRELSERIGALTEQSAQQYRELRHALNEQQRALSDDLNRRYQELTATLRREAYDLRNAKTDRTALAAMFTEVAQRLTSDMDGRA